LLKVKSAFALYVVYNINAPKYCIGDLIYVDTDMPLKNNMSVVLIGLNNEVIIGKLCSMNDEHIELMHYGAENALKFMKNDLQACYAIIGSLNAESLQKA